MTPPPISAHYIHHNRLRTLVSGSSYLHRTLASLNIITPKSP
ncbi:MAG: hypothetical protein R2706_03255 [Acidimicrobiales bacterium]